MSAPEEKVLAHFGAPMGRINKTGFRRSSDGEWIGLDIAPGARPVTLRKVRLDAGGYDQGGAYWGHGETLWYYCDASGSIDGYVRAPDRISAKASIKDTYPHARFYR